MEPPTSSRRRFLKGAAGAGAGALVIGAFSGSAAALDVPTDVVIAETGTEITNQRNPDNFHQVEFSNPLVETLSAVSGPPIVLMKPPSDRGPQPVHIRLRNVNSTGFEYRLEEWDYEDGKHAFEKTFWVAIAPVVAQVKSASGLLFNIEAGSVSTDTNGSAVDFNLTEADLAFDSRPIALAQPQTYNGRADSIVSRVDGVETSGFSVRLQEQESNMDYHQAERVGYAGIGVPSGGGLIDDLGLAGPLLSEFEARRPTRPIQDSREEASRIPFTLVNGGDGFDSNPRVVADMQTRRGPQPCNLRRTELTRDHMNVYVDEEQSKDPETTHVREDIGFLAFGSNGLLPATVVDVNTGVPSTL